jgi:hypothetical protein
MANQYIQAENGQFLLGNIPLLLRGFGIGSWMNFEHFMLRIPGTEKRIREVFAEVYGPAKADRFFDDLLTYFIADDDFRFLKSLGVNTIRLALNYRHFDDDQNPGNYKIEGFKQIDRVLGLCKEYGIYAILDMHTSPGGQNPDTHSSSETGVAGFWSDASLRERLINLWLYMADRYKKETIIAGFDILNEPSFVPDKKAFNDFYDRVIQSIRSVDNNHIIFLEGDYWARDFSIFNRLGGHQQAISFHFYPGQHVSVHDKPDIRQQQMADRLQYYRELREQTGLPLWCGETGGLFPANRRTEGNELLAQCLNIFEQHQISWSIWAYKDAQSMSLVYPKSDTPWMEFANGLRPDWQSKKKRTENVTNDLFNRLQEIFSYEINCKMKEKYSFRISSLLHELHMEYLVKPKLKSIPWNEMKFLPESFLWENCDYRYDMAALVKNHASPAPRS